jgi:hypothetical protein
VDWRLRPALAGLGKRERKLAETEMLLCGQLMFNARLGYVDCS